MPEPVSTFDREKVCTTDLLIVGGGAGGIFTGINAARNGVQTIVLEATSRLLSKVEISGGGRCNVTHACYEPRELVKNYPRGMRELLGPMARFHPQHTCQWFEERGVKLKTEDDGRIFPTTDDSRTVMNCLLHEAKRHRVKLELRTRVEEITKSDDRWHVRTKGGTLYKCRYLCIATGGSRHAHEFIQKLGHTITPLAPSLFTFEIEDPLLQGLAGLALPQASITLSDNIGTRGPVLVTHWGLSGPAALRLSSLAARELHAADYRMTLNVSWLSQYEVSAGLELLNRYREKNPKQIIQSNSPFEMPRRFWERISQLSGTTSDQTYAQLANDIRDKIIATTFKSTLKIVGKGEFKEEFVTCGGVALEEINFKHFESKIHPTLFFVGEVLDIDGITGGFNFQNAWTGGWHVAERVSQLSAANP